VEQLQLGAAQGFVARGSETQFFIKAVHKDPLRPIANLPERSNESPDSGDSSGPAHTKNPIRGRWNSVCHSAL
jgi:hypothetical protein